MGTTSSKGSKTKAALRATSPGAGSTPSGTSPAHLRGQLAQPSIKNTRRVQDIYEMKAVLGTGGYAVVWSAVHKTTRKEYAIKVMKATASATPKDDEVSVDEIRNEIEVMKKLQQRAAAPKKTPMSPKKGNPKKKRGPKKGPKRKASTPKRATGKRK